MQCKECNFKGEMIPMKRGPHVGHYCPKCGKWQGKWLSKEEKAMLAMKNIKIISKEEI